MLLKKGDRVVHCGAFHTEDPKVMRVTGIVVVHIQKAMILVLKHHHIQDLRNTPFTICLKSNTPIGI